MRSFGVRVSSSDHFAVGLVGGDVLSVFAAEAWNETEVPINISVVTEAINVSDDLLEDDNESTELDGNLSDAKLGSVSLRTSC